MSAIKKKTVAQPEIKEGLSFYFITREKDEHTFIRTKQDIFIQRYFSRNKKISCCIL